MTYCYVTLPVFVHLFLTIVHYLIQLWSYAKLKAFGNMNVRFGSHGVENIW